VTGREAGHKPLERPHVGADPDALEIVDGWQREKLEGWVPQLASEDELRNALEKAFDYRGDVTIITKDGSQLEGYLFDRRRGPTLNTSTVRLIPKQGDQKLSISYADIAALAFSGRDTAAGKTWEAWVKRYAEKKAAGEKNIALQPEPLD
jgi:hypothetical protein